MNEKLSPKKTRTALGGDYYILTLGVPSVLVECGFLSNAKEEALLLTEDYRQRSRRRLPAVFWRGPICRKRSRRRFRRWTGAANRTLKHERQTTCQPV